MYRQYKPSHSDFIIHWTGIDIDRAHDPEWYNNHSSKTDQETTAAYIARIKGTLKYGLWMTSDTTDEYIKNSSGSHKRPIVARTCFTELRLSEARNHAARFGRLGFGFKRFFLFDRLGAPMNYFIPHRPNWFMPPLSGSNISNSNYSSCFLKPMTVQSKDRSLEYKYFDESEWRIIYSEDIKEHLEKVGMDEVNKYFIPQNDMNDSGFFEYLKLSSESKWPSYLIPFKSNIWFAIIIYPSLSVKVEAEADEEIRQLIEQFKPCKPSNVNYCEGARAEKYNKPIEINLDSCRNF